MKYPYPMEGAESRQAAANRLATPRRTTIEDVARLAGVSHVTAARVLSGNPRFAIRPATRERVQGAARDLRYMPNPFAQSLRRQRSGIIGICIRAAAAGGDSAPATTVRLDPRLAGIGRHPASERYRWMIIKRNDADPALEDTLRAPLLYLDGLIYISPPRRDATMLARLAEGVPLVVEDAPGMPLLNSVSVDQARAMRQAVELLVARGSRRLGFITPAPSDYFASACRIEAFREVVAGHGLPLGDDQVAIAPEGPGGIGAATRRMLEAVPGLDGLILPRDGGLAESLQALAAAGRRVGDDMRVISVNETELCRLLRPTITALRFPVEEVAHQSFHLLHQQIEGRLASPARLMLPATLIERESTGAE